MYGDSILLLSVSLLFQKKTFVISVPESIMNMQTDLISIQLAFLYFSIRKLLQRIEAEEAASTRIFFNEFIVGYNLWPTTTWCTSLIDF